MKTNTAVKSTEVTYEGAPARVIAPEFQLRRAVMACMLWEGSFYEDGIEIADRIKQLVHKVDPLKVSEMAVEARTRQKLRHVPLLMVRELARHPMKSKIKVAETLASVIRRADDMTEFLSLYWKDGKQPLSAQVKKGLARAFGQFDEYQLAKYDRDAAVKLRDVLFLSHAKPVDGAPKRDKHFRKAALQGGAALDLSAGEDLYRKVVYRQMQTPDTWEVALSEGQNKKEAFERLMSTNKLGAMAFLRNLRGMEQAGVDWEMIRDYASRINTERVLPFRFLSAARALPRAEQFLEPLMLRCLANREQLIGRTAVVVDVSGSMGSAVSGRSEISRLDAAYGVAILLREICDEVRVFAFSNNVAEIPPRRGFALRDAIDKSMPHGGTYLGKAITQITNRDRFDRIVVITDEQSHDRVPNPTCRGYMINVAPYRNGVGYGPWIHIDGWSEAVVDYIVEYDKRC